MIADKVSVTVAPTAVDLTTLATVKTRLGITGAASDATLSALITSASTAIATQCRRPLGAHTITETFRIRSVGLNAARELDRQELLLTGKDPTITSVAVDAVAVPGAEYELDSGILRRITTDGNPTTWGGGTVVVVYQTGYALPGAAPAPLAEACIELVSRGFGVAARDPSVKRETVEGVGSVEYFDRGFGAMALDDTLRDTLAPYKAWVP